MNTWHSNGIDKDLLETIAVSISEGVQGGVSDAKPVYALLVKKGKVKPSEDDILDALNEYYKTKGYSNTNIKNIMWNKEVLSEIVTEVNRLAKSHK